MGIHNFGADREIVASLSHSTRDQCLHSKLTRNLQRLDVALLVTESRRARNDFDIREPREAVNDALCDSIAHVFRVWITAGVGEGQYSNRVDAGATTAGKIKGTHSNKCDNKPEGYSANQHRPS